jgi:hypothetical protein
MANAYDFDDSELSEIDKLVRRIYFEERSRFVLLRGGQPEAFDISKRYPLYDGGERPTDGRKFECVWPKLSQFIMDNGIDPRVFLRGAFTSTIGNSPPQPNMFMNAKILTLAKRSSYVTTDSLRIAYQSFLRKTQYEMRLRVAENVHPLETIFKIVISAPGIDTRPVFRYCMAIEAGLPKVAEVFVADAIIDYLFNIDAYESVIGKRLPDDFRKRAAQFRTAMARKHKSS